MNRKKVLLIAQSILCVILVVMLIGELLTLYLTLYRSRQDEINELTGTEYH